MVVGRVRQEALELTDSQTRPGPLDLSLFSFADPLHHLHSPEARVEIGRMHRQRKA